MNKKYLKLLTGGLIIGVILGFLLGVWHSNYRRDYENRVKKEADKQQDNDPYGGDTPKETLRLFIDALGKNDINLATKYFIIKNRKEWKEKLEDVVKKGLMGKLVKDLSQEKRDEKYNGDGLFTFYIYNEEGALANVAQMLLTHGSRKWKIEELQ